MDYAPYDITDNNSYFNLEEATVVEPFTGEDDKPSKLTTASTSPTVNNHLPGKVGESTLEKLYEATDGRGNFSKVVDFLGNTAEAESMKGKQTYNTKSSAAGIFHFLVGNGGGYTKEGKRTILGQYSKDGQLRRSSFEMAKKRLQTLISSPQNAEKIAFQPELVKDINKILEAKVPDNLTAQQQAVLAYAHLKLGSSDFDHYLSGNKEASDVYAKVWVTYKTQDSLAAIKKNWNRAVKANQTNGGMEGQFSFFGLTPRGHANFVTAPSVGNQLPGKPITEEMVTLPNKLSSTPHDELTLLNEKGPGFEQSFSSGGTMQGVGSFSSLLEKINSKRILIPTTSVH